MDTFQTVAARMDVIKVLESVELELIATSRDDNDSNGITLKAKGNISPMAKEVVPVFSHYRNISGGKLDDAVKAINAFIKEQFKPLIDEQKEAIKKLL